MEPSTSTGAVPAKQQLVDAAEIWVEDPTTLSDETVAEKLQSHEAATADRPEPETEMMRIERELADCAKAFTKANHLDGRSHVALARALAKVYVVGQLLIARQDVTVTLLKQRKIRFTKATLASPMLPAVKLAQPKLDLKTQSLYATVLNHALAQEYDAEGLHQAILEAGIAELRSRETRRQQEIKGEPNPQSEEAVLEEFREGRWSFPLDRIRLSDPTKFALAIVGFKEGELRVFVLDDDRKRVLAAIRHALRNCLGFDKDGMPLPPKSS